MGVKVSVIIPVYNDEKFLEMCLNSLFSQTLDDLEIIVVNDGSTDGSQNIIDSFVSKYPGKIIALRCDHNGPGPARNLGMEHASGEYLGFVDSDDRVDSGMYRKMYDIAANDDSDAVICDYTCVYEHNNTSRVFKGLPANEETTESITDFVLYSTNPAYLWNKIYKRDFVRKIGFPPGIYEDVATTPIILSHCEKISYLKEPFYFYFRRSGSITSQRYTPRNLDVIKAWERCLAKCNPDYMKEVAYAVYYSISEFVEYKPENCLDYIKFFRDNISIFSDNDYIRSALTKHRFKDLFSIKNTPANTGDISPITQTIKDFLSETKVLIEQLDTLPPETVTELSDMHNTMLIMGSKNITDAGEDIIRELCERQEKLYRK